ncbi:SET and MYND domain-containing protein 5 [Collichthys lucidus]|uniref:SET and MYND domain-containing protein 5 n=1 Tax=Collichthys lucidus TaxID=240159 RepID=A0A4U5UDN9_COLLU|nr:SET and MYND domain-containing protein 5 [Collichthys lucidus]
MAAPLDDMFSFCVDPGKVAASVEVRFIDNIKPVSTAYVLWRLQRRMRGDSAASPDLAFLTLSSAAFDQSCTKPAPSARSMHYPPETSSIMLMARMVAVVKQAKNKAHWQKLFAHFCSRAANEEEEIAHKLLGEQFRWFVPEGFRSLFALVGTNGQGIGTSSLSRWVHACDALELPAQQREQLDSFIDQLYKDIEKGNHSCIPNAEASFPDNNFLLQLSALSDINPGEEICISYLDCCQRDRSRHSRHKILRENYLFVCSCPKCVSQMDELDVTSEEEEEEEGEAEGETEGDEMEDEMTDV